MNPISLNASFFAMTYDTSPEIAQAIIEKYPDAFNLQSRVWCLANGSEREEILMRAWQLTPPDQSLLDWHGPVVRREFIEARDRPLTNQSGKKGRRHTLKVAAVGDHPV